MLVRDMAQIGRSSSRRPQLVGWLVGLDEKSIFGTEKTPGGRAQVLVASFKSKSIVFPKNRFLGRKKPPEGAPKYWWLAWIHNIPLKQTQEASKSKIGFPSKTARLIVNLQPDRPFSMPRS